MVATPESKLGKGFLKTKIKTYIPFPVQRFLYSFIKKARLLKNKHTQRFAKEDIKKWLADAGLKKDDCVVVHSSLGRVGFVEQGADTIIDAFQEIIGSDGLLAMPTFSAPDYDEKTKIYTFDVRNTPAYTGKIPDTFRKRPDVYRSHSPKHSVAAWGKKAHWLTAGHDTCDNPYAKDGPWGKLYELNAKIFLIGVDQLANSTIHVIEGIQKYPIPVFTEKMKAVIIDEQGQKKNISFRTHLHHLDKIKKCNIMEPYLHAENLMKVYPFGQTELRVMQAKEYVCLMQKLLEKGITIYNQ